MVVVKEVEVMTAELSAKAEACEISAIELHQLVGVWPLPADTSSQDHEGQARRLLELLSLLRAQLGDLAAQWLRSPCEPMDGQRPLAVMLDDPKRISLLRNMLRAERYE